MMMTMMWAATAAGPTGQVVGMIVTVVGVVTTFFSIVDIIVDLLLLGPQSTPCGFRPFVLPLFRTNWFGGYYSS
jgi:hypothetical protein